MAKPDKAINELLSEYDRLYGHIPDDPDEQIKYIYDKFNVKENKVNDILNQLNSLNWESISFTLPIIPKPSSRPRSSSNGHFYVPGAAVHHRLVKSLIEYKNIVFTPCKIKITVYLPIPSSMTAAEVLLANKGLILPCSGGDWDNFAKTYCDGIQNLLIINDNIIVDGICSKRYSIKPHVDIELSYLNGFDCKYNEKKILKSKSYIINSERVN